MRLRVSAVKSVVSIHDPPRTFSVRRRNLCALCHLYLKEDASVATFYVVLF